jgi:glutathione S-transferase
MNYGKLVLVSHHLCPYVQRSVITLNEKQIPHERIYIDLGNKPDWFLAISPLGRVPLLQVGDQVLFESAVICEFLDEITPGSLHPSDTLFRAQHRAWIEYGSQLLNDIARLYNAASDTAFAEACATVRTKLLRLEPAVTGPWFGGKWFSMVDAAYGPIFRYFDTLDSYLPENVFAGCPRLNDWRRRLADRITVRSAVAYDYPSRLKEFLLRRDSALSRRIQALDDGEQLLPAQSLPTL